MNSVLIVDMLTFAIEHRSPATVILVAGDRDYAYAISALRFKKYTVVLIVPPAQNIPQSLESQASVVIDWNYAILRKPSEADTPPVWQPYDRGLDEDILERLVREIRDSNEGPAVTLSPSSHPTATAPAYTHAVHPAPAGTPKRAVSTSQETSGQYRVGSAASRARSRTHSSQTVPDIDRASGSNEGAADDRVSTANAIQAATDDLFTRPAITSPHLDRYDNITAHGSPSIRHFSLSPSPPAALNLGSRTTPSYSRTCMPSKAANIFSGTPGHHGVGSEASRARSTTQSTHTVPDIDKDSGSDEGVTDDRVSTANAIQTATYAPFTKPPITSPRLECYRDIAEPCSPPIRNFPLSPPPPATFNLGSRTTPSHSRTISGGTPISYGNPLPQRTVPAAMPLSPTPTGERSNAASALKSTNTGSVLPIMDDSILPSDHAAVMNAFGLDDEVEDGYSSNESANASTNNPHLTGVADDSLSYDMNAVQSRFNDGQAFFHDMRRSPVNDTSSLITDLSGAPTSQQSYLAPSSSNTNVTMPNVEIGSPPQVIPSVIGANSGNNSSAYQTLPESIENRIRHLPQFLPLINLLLLARSKGNMKSDRSKIADALIHHDKDVYKHAGVSKFRQYVSQAERASLIELGGSEDGTAWITLHPDLFKEETTPKSPTPPPAHSSSLPQDNVNLSISSTTLPLYATAPPLPAVADIPLYFQPLITCLANIHMGGMCQPRCSSVGSILGPSVYARAGVGSMEEYLSLALNAGIVEIGGANDLTWVKLHPDVLSGERTCYIASLSSCVTIFF